jgi:hypothetical protein
MKKMLAGGLTMAAIVVLGMVSWQQDGKFGRVVAGAGGDLREQLAGEWSLVSRVTTLRNGKVLEDHGLGTVPHGVLIYDRLGHVAAQLSRAGRTVEMLSGECGELEKIRGTEDTAQTVLGYDAYFGTYTIDEKAGIVTHHLEGAIFPGDVGKDIRRNFVLAGDALTITFDTTTRDGLAVTRKLVWTRLK